MRITGNSADSLKFVVPSLRNVSVLDRYRGGIQKGATLDSSLMKPIIMTDWERDALVYFLHTLRDTSFLKTKDSRNHNLPSVH